MTYMLPPQVKAARYFAEKAHQAQTYGNGLPYTKHLDDVYNVLIRFGFSESNPAHLNILTAAYLHDSMEDTATSYSDLKRSFNEEVAEIVYCMTDELGRNRKEKKEKTYPKIRENPKSLILKLADRIANIENSIGSGVESDFLSMYKKEYSMFRWNLKIPGHAEKFWNHLDKLMEYSDNG